MGETDWPSASGACVMSVSAAVSMAVAKLLLFMRACGPRWVADPPQYKAVPFARLAGERLPVDRAILRASHPAGTPP